MGWGRGTLRLSYPFCGRELNNPLTESALKDNSESIQSVCVGGEGWWWCVQHQLCKWEKQQQEEATAATAVAEPATQLSSPELQLTEQLPAGPPSSQRLKLISYRALTSFSFPKAISLPLWPSWQVILKVIIPEHSWHLTLLLPPCLHPINYQGLWNPLLHPIFFCGGEEN